MFNLIWNNREITVKDAKDLVESGQTVTQFMPLTLHMPDDKPWVLPHEPLISISGENVVKMRSVAKSTGRGTIKERFTEGDFKISIQGVFIGEDVNALPEIEIQKLLSVLTQKRAVAVQNEFFQLLNINYITVLSYELPFTKTENAQNFLIEAVSDDMYNLFIDVE